MTKIISIFLLSIYLLGATELHQLVKLPRMIEHYQEFQRQNPGYGLETFLRVHYLYPLNTSDSDYDKDSQLPFKSGDFNCTLLVADVLVPQPYYFSTPKAFLPERKYPLLKDNFIPFVVSLKIFQPPKA